MKEIIKQLEKENTRLFWLTFLWFNLFMIAGGVLLYVVITDAPLGQYWRSQHKIIIYPDRHPFGWWLNDTEKHEYCHYMVHRHYDHFCESFECIEKQNDK